MRKIVLQTVVQAGPSSWTRNLDCTGARDARNKLTTLAPEVTMASMVEQNHAANRAPTERVMHRFVKVNGEWYELGEKVKK